MMHPNYIIIHTAAFRGENCDADLINQWHLNNGWQGIGYHYVILNNRHNTKADGTIETGRDIKKIGAHARGLNSQSIGICCVGHGDYDNFTAPQYASLYKLITELMTKFNIDVSNVIGHREINNLIQQAVLPNKFKTDKSCPGTKIDMPFIRQQLGSLIAKNSQIEPLSQLSNTTPVTDKNAHSQVKQDLTMAYTLLKRHEDMLPNSADFLEKVNAIIHS